MFEDREISIYKCEGCDEDFYYLSEDGQLIWSSGLCTVCRCEFPYSTYEDIIDDCQLPAILKDQAD